MGDFWVLEGTTPRFKAPYLYLKGIFGSWKVQISLFTSLSFGLFGSWQPSGGLEFIRSFRKASEDQRVNLPPNLAQLVHSAAYGRSEDSRVWRYFYDLAGNELPLIKGLH